MHFVDGAGGGYTMAAKAMKARAAARRPRRPDRLREGGYPGKRPCQRRADLLDRSAMDVSAENRVSKPRRRA